MIWQMRLHYRLALPIISVALLISVVIAIGVTAVIMDVFGTGLSQASGQLTRIVANALRVRSAPLDETASVFAALRGPMRRRNDAWKHLPLAAGALVTRPSGSVLSSFGAMLDPTDLAALAADRRVGLAVVRSASGLMIAGMARDHSGRLAVVAQPIDISVVRELQSLLQADVDVKSAGKTIATSRSTAGAERETWPVTSALATPGGGQVLVTMWLPYREVHRARVRAREFGAGLGVILVSAALGLSWYVAVRISRPVGELMRATDRIAEGDYSATISPEAPAELGALMSRFNAMARRLDETRQKLVHSAKLSSVGQIIAGVSHELNNPLSGMLGQADHLLSKFPPGDPLHEKIASIVSEGQRMRRILGELRGLTRANAPEQHRVEIGPLLTDVVTLVRHDAAEAGVLCSTALPVGSMAVQGAPDELRQVVLNLLLNAIQATPSGGRVEVSLVRSNGGGQPQAELRVTDTGTGIPVEVLNRIPEPFFTTKRGRMGLGLSISRELVERHGGSLCLVSEAGKGTTVTVVLPELPA